MNNKVTDAKINVLESNIVNADGTFTVIPKTNAKEKAKRLIRQFGPLAINVVAEVLGSIQHEDNVMYYEITFWKEVKDIIMNK
jgi:hypothetical protein